MVPKLGDGGTECIGTHAMIDNATILNACSALADPQSINEVIFLDLVSLVESLLLFDHLHTIVGSSFAFGHRPARTDGHWDVRSPRNVYGILEGYGLLKPLVVDAAWRRYHIENLDVVDAIASSADIPAIIARAIEQYPSESPWGEATFGRGATGDDSYPIYCFEGPTEAAVGGGADRSPASRRRSPEELFVSQTFYYVVASWLRQMPLTVSAFRRKLVEQMAEDVGSYAGADADLIAIARSKGEESLRILASAFPSQNFSLTVPPLFRQVLESCRNGQDELLARIIEMRDDRRFRAFRDWCGRLTEAARDGRLSELHVAAREIDALSAPQDPKGESTQLIAKVIVKPVDALEDLAASGLGKAIDHLSRPHLILLRDLGKSSRVDPLGLDEFRRVFGVALN